MATIWPTQAEHFWLINASSAVVFAVPGWYLARHRPGVPYGWFALIAGLAHGFGGLGFEVATAVGVRGADLPGITAAVWLVAWAPMLEQPVLMAIYTLYPGGRMPDGRLRWPALASIALAVAGVVMAGLDRHPARDATVSTLARVTVPWGVPGASSSLDVIPLFFAPSAVLAIGVLFTRWRRAEYAERSLLEPLLVVGAVITVLVPLSIELLPAASSIAIGQGTTLIELAVIIAATLRNHVYGVTPVLNRALVYGILSGLVATVFGLVGGAATALGYRVGALPAYIAAAICVVGISPMRAYIQERVQQLLYGDRANPYLVLSKIGTGTESAGTSDELLQSLIEATRDVLRVPYVALEFTTVDGTKNLRAGEPTEQQDRLPLLYRGSDAGTLTVGMRGGESDVPRREQELRVVLARQAAVAVSAAVLTSELQRSREQMVLAQEEERRRLRIDLHDGVGPQLTGIGLGLDLAAERLAESDPAVARDVEMLRREVEDTLNDVRRLVQGLRPPRLDEVGLIGAIREVAERASRGVLRVEVEAPVEPSYLPAAVEVAAYRITSEAVTNVVRHASATQCLVRVLADDSLSIVVTDNGVGMSGSPLAHVGTGMESIRQRTHELRWAVHHRPQLRWRRHGHR